MLLVCSSVHSQKLFYDFEDGQMPEDIILLNEDGLTPALEDDVSWRDTAWIVTMSSTFEGFAALSISWYADENGNDVGPADDWLILPKLMIESGTELSFKAKSATTSGNFPDDFQVLINSEDPTRESFEANGEILLSIDDEASVDFTSYTLDLSAYSGQSVHIAFRNITNVDGYGLWLDDIQVDDLSGLKNVNAYELAMQVNPNPVMHNAVLNFNLDQSTQAQVQIINAAGQLIRTQKLGHLAPGKHRVDLDVINLPQGMYNARIQTDHFLSSTNFIIGKR